MLMKLEFSPEIFEKYENINLHEILSVGAELFQAERRTDGQTDRHYEAKSRFSQFCEKRLKLRILL